MSTLAERAHANAKRARDAQDAGRETRQEVTSPSAAKPLRSPWWRIWKADDTVADVTVCPPMTRAEVRSTFYPDAKSVLLPDEA